MSVDSPEMNFVPPQLINSELMEQVMVILKLALFLNVQILLTILLLVSHVSFTQMVVLNMSVNC